ncbi:MAG TPA: aldehyde dehydrogenase family protein [Trebonia sp.]
MGLCAGVRAPNTNDAVAVARRIQAGQVFVNGGRVNPAVPFGGYKTARTTDSGVGSFPRRIAGVTTAANSCMPRSGDASGRRPVSRPTCLDQATTNPWQPHH